MAYDIPLPKVVADVGPGGPLVTAMQGINALTKSNLENKYYAPNIQSEIGYRNALAQGQNITNQYLPDKLRLANAMAQLENKMYIPKTQAQINSENAYAKFMAPQFIAKLMSNNAIVANSPTLQDPSTISRLIGMSINPTGEQQQGNNSHVNPLTIIPNGQPFSLASDQQGHGDNFQSNNIIAPPTQVDNALPNNKTSLPPAKTYAENAADYESAIAEGKESGKIRAQQMKDLDEIVFNAETKQATLDDINNMIASPEIREIRQMPLLGRHEMGWYAKEGTPAQQQLVGRLYTQMGNVVKDSSRDFNGQFRRGEQQLLQGMKPNDSDTIDTMIGKSESLSVMNKMLLERSKLTSKLMREYHISQGHAQELADKEVKGENIRQQIHDKLNPTITIKNRKTGEVKTIPISEARKLGVPNV